MCSRIRRMPLALTRHPDSTCVAAKRIEVDVAQPGAERAGLPAEVLDQADHIVHIPIASESLNAAMAATIALYELRT